MTNDTILNNGKIYKNKIIRIELKEDIEWKDLKYLCNKLSKIKGCNFDIHHSFNTTLVRNKGLKNTEVKFSPPQFEHDSSPLGTLNPTQLQEDSVVPSKISIVENEAN